MQTAVALTAGTCENFLIMSRILIVEDERGLSGAIKDWLESQFYLVSVVEDGLTALERLSRDTFDAIVLDLMLPGLSGLEVCRRYRDVGGAAPILILTARSTLASKEDGLDCGADDYLVKPCDLRELSARLRAIMRRPASAPIVVFKVSDIELDTNARQVRKSGRIVHLLPKEFLLLEALLMNAGSVLSVERLIDLVWGTNSSLTPDTVRSHMRSLRSRIESERGHGRCLIRTIHGRGYLIERD